MKKPSPIDHPWIDSSRAPLYVWTFPPSTTDELLSACCAARETWARSAKHPVAWVVDLSAVREVNARQRRIFGDHLERFEMHDVHWNRGSAIVVPNAFQRGVLTAIFWIKAPKFPHQVFATREDAMRWAEERLRANAEGASAAPR